MPSDVFFLLLPMYCPYIEPIFKNNWTYGRLVDNSNCQCDVHWITNYTNMVIDKDGVQTLKSCGCCVEVFVIVV